MEMEVGFNGSSNPLSNMFMFPLVWNDQWFKGTEYAYTHAKLSFHGLYTEAANVNMLENGFEAKEFASKKIKEWLGSPSPQWYQAKIPIMRSLLLHKFHQCADYRLSVLQQGIFKEDTFDTFWGRGRHDEGLNTLGQLHMELRDSIQHRILIAGTSHARQLDSLIHNEFLRHDFRAAVDLICMPGGQVAEVRSALEERDLSVYSVIFIICGGNNLYYKDGDVRMAPHQLVKELTALRDDVSTATMGKVILSPVFPRRVSTTDKVPAMPVDHFRTRNKWTKYVNQHVVSSFQVPEFWSGEFANSHWFMSDGIHLKMEGKQLLIQRLLQFL